MDDQFSSSPKASCCPWQSHKKKAYADQSGTKNRRKFEKTAYYGDYGLESDIYGENEIISMKKYEKSMKKGMKEQDKALNKVTKKKGFIFAMKGFAGK
ncbi:hypothetical protein CASFOL_011002 [Castilleja foliolosa]|uniref:Uncharacterized protein n=1 Tax=Castilleja foliolosa TaxID=1961234 RepID=A0ABD3DUU2_9LAMI